MRRPIRRFWCRLGGIRLEIASSDWRRVALCGCAASCAFGFVGHAWGASPPSFAKLAGPGRSLTANRENAVAATLPDGEILIAGGVETPDGGKALTSAELFNPTADTFSKLTGPRQSLTAGRGNAVASALPDGQVLIAGGNVDGGESLSSAELFNPTTDTFAKLTGAHQSLTEARSNALAAELPSGEVLIAGGELHYHPVASAELFNPTTDTFSGLEGAGKALTEPRAGAIAATLPSGKVLIAGGYGESSLSSAELFNPSTETFTRPTGPGQSLLEKRSGPVAVTLQSGQVLVAGGSDPPPCNSHCADIGPPGAELFNPATDTFEVTSPPALTRHGAVVARLPSGQVLIAGGYTERQANNLSAELFTPEKLPPSAHRSALLPAGVTVVEVQVKACGPPTGCTPKVVRWQRITERQPVKEVISTIDRLPRPPRKLKKCPKERVGGSQLTLSLRKSLRLAPVAAVTTSQDDCNHLVDIEAEGRDEVERSGRLTVIKLIERLLGTAL